VLKQGELVEVGETRQVIERPVHPYTQMLIASVPSHEPPARPAPTGADQQPVLKTEGLAKSYLQRGWLRSKGGVDAAADVSIEVRRGQTLGIVGESGSGKSTVARCVARLIEPSRGRILIAGTDIAPLSNRKLRPYRRHVQIIFQDPYRSLNPRRTVGDSIIEGPMNFGQSRADALAHARRLMELVRLDPESLDRYPHQFSGGQRQRIAIARALAMEPDLLIADEAVSALDVSVQAQVLRLLEDIRKQFDLAMLFITHDLRVAAQVCDDVAVMSRGRIVEYGSASDVFGNPRHEYTRALFDAAPGRHARFGGH
jgi:peptide/nickel transport system ATP-binding protein